MDTKKSVRAAGEQPASIQLAAYARNVRAAVRNAPLRNVFCFSFFCFLLFFSFCFGTAGEKTPLGKIFGAASA